MVRRRRVIGLARILRHSENWARLRGGRAIQFHTLRAMLWRPSELISRRIRRRRSPIGRSRRSVSIGMRCERVRLRSSGLSWSVLVSLRRRTLLTKAQSWIQRCTLTARRAARSRQVDRMATRWALRGRNYVLGREDVLVAGTWAVHRRSARNRTCDEGEAPGIIRCTILILPTAASPIQANAIVAGFSTLGAIRAHGLLFAALHLSGLARPAASATALLGLRTILSLRPRHRVPFTAAIERRVCDIRWPPAGTFREAAVDSEIGSFAEISSVVFLSSSCLYHVLGLLGKTDYRCCPVSRPSRISSMHM